MLSKFQRMSYRRLKVFLIALITGVFVQYSVAWAVLECFHGDEDDAQTAASMVAKRYLASTLPSHLKGNIQCIGSEYRIEPLAASSAPNQPSSLTGNMGSQAHGLSILHEVVDTASANLWLFALFEHVSIPIFPIDSPRYLSLSVLRI